MNYFYTCIFIQSFSSKEEDRYSIQIVYIWSTPSSPLTAIASCADLGVWGVDTSIDKPARLNSDNMIKLRQEHLKETVSQVQLALLFLAVYFLVKKKNPKSFRFKIYLFSYIFVQSLSTQRNNMNLMSKNGQDVKLT